MGYEIKTWLHCDKHGGYGFRTDCIECNRNQEKNDEWLFDKIPPLEIPDMVLVSIGEEKDIKYVNKERYRKACIDAYKKTVKTSQYDFMVVEAIKQVFE